MPTGLGVALAIILVALPFWTNEVSWRQRASQLRSNFLAWVRGRRRREPHPAIVALEAAIKEEIAENARIEQVASWLRREYPQAAAKHAA